MALYACVKNFSFAAVATVPYNQVVTGVVDPQTGIAFEGHTFILFNCSSTLNNFGPVVTTDAGTLFNCGIARGTTEGASAGVGDILALGSTKVISGCGLGRYSICTNGPSLFFGGSILDIGYISAIAAGSFTITWDLRTDLLFLPVVTCLILGGDGWNIDIANTTWNSVNSTAGAPQGVLEILALSTYSSSFSSGTGAGGANQGIAWATKDGIYGSASYNEGNDNARIQLHDRTSVALIPGLTPVQDSGVPIVSDWGANSWTGAGAGGGTGVPSHISLAFSGDGVICKAGTFDAPIIDGSLAIDLGVDPMFVIFASAGMVDSTDPNGVQMSISIGWTDRDNVGSIWTAEDSLQFTGLPPLHGSEYLSDSILTLSAVPNRSSTVPHNKMTIDPITGHDGIIHVNFDDTDGTEPNIIWFAVGVALTEEIADRGKGIYKLVPDKRQDTIWFDVIEGSTYLAKKPDPNAIGSLLGDE